MKTALAALLLAGTAVAAEPKAHKDIPYTDPKTEKQTLDVYAPPDGKGRPVVVWIHGGGWQAGDKKEVNKKPQAFAEKGLVFVSVNYRLLPAVTIQEMAGDVAKAIRWVRDHAKEYGGDPDALIVTGHSAGAQLAALVCTDDKYLKAEKVPFAAIKACIPVDGDTYDVPLQIATVEERRSTLYKKKFGDEASQKELSPVTHAAKGKGIPPFLILHVADHPEVKMQSEKLVKALTAAGVPATLHPAPGKTHVAIDADLGAADDKPTAAVFAFLDKVLKPRTLAFFQSKLSKALTMATAEEVFGKPDRDIGSGLHIHEYALDDGSKVLLGFGGPGPIFYAKLLTMDGKREDLPLK